MNLSLFQASYFINSVPGNLKGQQEDAERLNKFVKLQNTMIQHDEKIELLRRVDFFSELREYEFDVIVGYSEFVSLRKGEAIFSRDEESKELYVVKEGRVGIVGVESEESVNIAQIIAGEAFGHLDFLAGENRNASAFAEEDSLLLKFPAVKNLPEIFNEHPFISARLLYRLMSIISERIWETKKMLYDKNPLIWDLHKQVLSDKLTGLYNRNFLNEDFLNMIPDLGKSAAMLMIKPDNFKEINDRFGHEAGDRALTLLAIFLQSELNENDIAIRYHGDEYAAILVDTDRDGAISRAKSISSTFKSMALDTITGGEDITIQVSIGITIYPDNVTDGPSMVRRAHEKMLTARSAGGNRISL